MNPLRTVPAILILVAACGGSSSDGTTPGTHAGAGRGGAQAGHGGDGTAGKGGVAGSDAIGGSAGTTTAGGSGAACLDWRPAPEPGCNLLCQSCAAGQACDVVDSTTTVVQACRPAGPATQGAQCSTPNDCAAGFGCFFVPGSGSECRRYCRTGDPSADGCEDGTTCNFYIIEGSSTLGACAPPITVGGGPGGAASSGGATCVPYLADPQGSACDVYCQGCGTGETCVLVNDPPPAPPMVCKPAGSATEGAACDDQTSPCGVGLACVGAKCIKYCRFDAPGAPSCAANQTCAFYAFDAGRTLGSCQ